MTYYRRRPLTHAERLLAGAAGAAVGAIAFYLTRLWLEREPLEEGPPGDLEIAAEDEGAERLPR